MSAVVRSDRGARLRALALAALAGSIGASPLFGCSDPFEDCDGCCTGEGCGFEAPPPTSLACVDAPERDPGVVLVLGYRSGDTFTPFVDGQNVGIDFGGQGGSHFYFAAQVLGAPAGATFFARYQGANDSGSFVRASSQSCGEQWLELDAYVQLDRGNGGVGTLTVQVGTCADSGCSTDDRGSYVPTELYASEAIELAVGGR